MLNKKQALELFEREAFYYVHEDTVPIVRVRQLFGDQIVNAVLETNYVRRDCEYSNLRDFLYFLSMNNI